MTERLETLFRSLESALGKIEKDLPFDGEESRAFADLAKVVEGIRPEGVVPGPEPLPAARRPAGTLTSFRRLRIPLAAAAGILIAVGLFGLLPGHGRGGLGLSIQHLPESARGEERIDRFQVSASEECHVFILFRTWDAEKRALTWAPYQWEGRQTGPLARLAKGESVKAKMDVGQDPRVAQFMLVAASRSATDLPADGDAARALAERVERAYRPPGGGESLADCVAALRSCLPASVEVFGREFVVQ